MKNLKLILSRKHCPLLSRLMLKDLALLGFSFRFKSMIPITFLTGFYVTEVMRRYWDQFMSLPFPDVLALKLVSYIPGKVKY